MLELQCDAATRTNAVPFGAPAVRSVRRFLEPLVASATLALCCAHEARRLPHVEIQKLTGERLSSLPSLTPAASVRSASFSIGLHTFFANGHIRSFPLPSRECKLWTLCTTLATHSRLYVSFDNRVPIQVVAAPMPQQQLTETLISLLKQLCLESAENEQIFPVSNARHGDVGCQSTADGFV